MIVSLDKDDYRGSTVVLASPSVGNIGQLALDLIISSTKAVRVGQLWHEAILPLVGYDPYNLKSDRLCTSNDIYFSPERKLLLVQLRAPLCREYQSNYLKELTDWLKSLGVGQVVILAGLFAHSRDDADLKHGSFRYVTCPLSESEHSSLFGSLNWVRMKGNEKENQCPPLKGAGFARNLFNLCVEASLKCTALLYFCLDGDNASDSICYTRTINQWIPFVADVNKNIVIPPSWKFLFGSSTPNILY